MQPLSAYLNLRRRLLGRQLREVGVLRLALLVPMLLVVVGAGWRWRPVTQAGNGQCH